MAEDKWHPIDEAVVGVPLGPVFMNFFLQKMIRNHSKVINWWFKSLEV